MLSDAVVRRLAGEKAYERGRRYYLEGRVEPRELDATQIEAVVQGSQNYKVTVSLDRDEISHACDCPQGADDIFCKHCVATVFAWLQLPRGKAAKRVTQADIAKVLQNEDKDTLVRLMLDWAKDDKRMRERLLQYAARRLGPKSGVAAARQAFERAVRIHNFVHYREAAGWAQGVDDAIDNIERLLEDGQLAPVIELCEWALQKLLGAAEEIDDSDGHWSMLRDRLQEIHFRACQEARPDPVALAERLFGWELDSELDVFYGAAATYAEILGPGGLQKYRELAKAEWKKVPVRTANEKAQEWGEHFRITHIMESLAKESGDTEELVAVLSRDLSHAYNYLKIAEVYRDAGQHDQSLEWIEKGLKAFPDRTDVRLRRFAAEEYHLRQRHDDAMNLMWADFCERPFLETYATLDHHAQKAGNWPEWRDRALAEIRRRITKTKQESRGQTAPRWMHADQDHSPLVEIFLYERDAEAAWREAQSGGCSDSLWLRLAAARENDHPADAAPIYLKQAEDALMTIRNGRYEKAVELLAKAAAVMKRMERSADFVRILDALRMKYKIKRNFIKLVEAERKSLYLG